MALLAEERVIPEREVDSPRFMVKAFIMAVSFANLSILNVWAEMLDPEFRFFRRYAVSWQELTGVTLYVLLLATILWIPICYVARSGNRKWIRVLKWCVFCGLLLPLNLLRVSNEASSIPSLPMLQFGAVRVLIGVIGVTGGLLLLWKWQKLSTAVTTTILVMVSPALPLAVTTIVRDIHSGPPQALWPTRPLLDALPQKDGAPRVIWVVFDEWDKALTFEHRPAKLQLPELDSFRNLSFHAEHATAPNVRTIVSVPSLLTGKVYAAERYAGANELILRSATATQGEKLTEQASIFSEVRQRGFNAGAVGFYFPYCRLFDTVSCNWYPSLAFSYPEWNQPFTVWQFMGMTLRRHLGRLPLAGRLGITHAVREDNVKPWLHAGVYRETLKSSLQTITDQRLNFVFLHWNIPHPPSIYDAAKQDFSDGPENTYIDSLKLLDRTLHDLRVTLQQSGLWDKTTILLSSDHPLRLNLWPRRFWAPVGIDVTQTNEVPFLLKLARQKQSLAYDSPLQTVVSKDLILAIMNSEVTQPEQIAAWLDTHPPRRLD